MKSLILGYAISIFLITSSATAQSLPIEEALQLLFEDTNLEERISFFEDKPRDVRTKVIHP